MWGVTRVGIFGDVHIEHEKLTIPEACICFRDACLALTNRLNLRTDQLHTSGKLVCQKIRV